MTPWWSREKCKWAKSPAGATVSSNRYSLLPFLLFFVFLLCSSPCLRGFLVCFHSVSDTLVASSSVVASKTSQYGFGPDYRAVAGSGQPDHQPYGDLGYHHQGTFSALGLHDGRGSCTESVWADLHRWVHLSMRLHLTSESTCGSTTSAFTVPP